MVFEGKKLSEVSEADLQKLVQDQVQERDTLEYKSDMYGSKADDKREMLKDISSFANNRGGYLIIGMEADKEGIPKEVRGVGPGNHVERITSSCLSNIDKRIVGLEVDDHVELQNGRRVVIVSIPHSFNAPHMITFEGLNQFWKRHGRQKEKMTVYEIAEAFERSLADTSRLERFLFARRAKLLEQIRQDTYLVLSAIPAFLSNEVVFDVRDKTLKELVVNPPNQIDGETVQSGYPYPTLDGLRAYTGENYRVLEVFRNGYVEFAQQLYRSSVEPKDKRFHPAYRRSVVNFVRFVQELYSRYLPLMPVAIQPAVLNARGMPLMEFSPPRLSAPWLEQHLELGTFYAENLPQEAESLSKKICDRLWQAFGREHDPGFDETGNLKAR